MKKLLLTLLLSLGLTTISSAGYLDDWTDDQLCGWMDNPSPPDYMVDEVKKRELSCGGDDSELVGGGESILDKLKLWNKVLRGKKPIYTAKGGTQIKVNPIGDEKSIKLIKPF